MNDAEITIILAASLVLLLVPRMAVAQAYAAGASPSQRLPELFERHDQWERDQFPEVAMERGDYSNAHRITDVSLAAIKQRHQDMIAQLEALHAISPAELSGNDQVSYNLFDVMLSREVRGHRFRTFLMPVGGRHGPHQDIPQMGERVRFSSAEDYRNYLTRLEQAPGMLDDTIKRMTLGVIEGRTPPRVTLEGLPEQFDSLLAEGRGLTMLAEPFDRIPDSMDEIEAKTLRERFESQSMPVVRGAIERFRDYVVKEYIPACRETIAAADLPDGKAFYEHQLYVMTTLEITAQQVHETGLNEVARIRREMMDVIRRSDFLELHPQHAQLDDDALFAAFIDYLRTDERFYYDDPQELLDGYRVICKKVDAWMPKFFSTLPRQPYGVKEIPAFMAPNQTTAYYSPGDIRNAEPGYFYANTYALDQRPKYEMIALAMHEAVPGHHHQIAVAKEIDGVPEFRRQMWITSYGEGWALYSERLGIEMELYESPYDDFGRLLYEMWRATRLVVDPGMHALGWTRRQAIDFMAKNTALSMLNIENEVDRYIAWPGQACAYKLGELKIRELRAKAEAALGERFGRCGGANGERGNNSHGSHSKMEGHDLFSSSNEAIERAGA